MVDRDRPAFGAQPAAGGTRFTLWAPEARQVTLVIEPPDSDGRPVSHGMARAESGLWTAVVEDAVAGDRYRLRADAGPFWPDPASRFQPDGVHGPSAIVDASAFAWTDQRWRGLDLDDAIVYELHAGTFSPEGTFDGIVGRLPYLADLGVTAIELMPIAESGGRWNWGYDGAALFAPSRHYGGPDGLRRLVNEAHRLGLAVLLDVVYNHLGPDGAYLAAFVPNLFAAANDSPWGGGLDFDGPIGLWLREFFTANAVHWIDDYHVDGLRLDATHAIVERHPTFVADLADAVRRAAPDRQVLVIAEDHRNLATMVRPRVEGGWGLDAVWADDFHHHVRRHLTGEHEGYYEDFSGSTIDLADAIQHGWFYRGQHAPFFGGQRGSDTTGVPRERFVICIQNHDQIGNRALGERLNHQIDAPCFAAASILLLLAPETPLLFMGQEWAASTPFQFFTDHGEPLGTQVVEGRRREFRHFSAFRDPEAAGLIPSPQDAETFRRSRLNWDERADERHRQMESLYREAIGLRRRLRRSGVRVSAAAPADLGAVVLRHLDADDRPSHLTLVRLSGQGRIEVVFDEAVPGTVWRIELSTERTLAGTAPVVDHRADGRGVAVELPGPGAVVLACDEAGKDRA